MSKYQPLAEHLGHLEASEWRPTFHELERMIGTDLPKAAHKASWWSDSEKGHAATWTAAGWTAEPDVEGEKVIFRKRSNGMSENTDQGQNERGRLADRGRELLETGREVVNTGREQVMHAAERAAPAVKKYGPWAALGAAVVGVVSFITFRSLQKRGE
jgi:ElaB/YqjD/DUF883 family membrane-anchored ribosome-binding protein